MVHIRICWGEIYWYTPLRSSHAGLKWHVPSCMLAILVYHCNKQVSNVLLSIQFDTNDSQLLRRVLPWSYDPLPSLGELSSSSLNRLSVCLSCLICLCIPPVVYGRPVLCLLCLRVALFSKAKKGVFSFFKKNGENNFKKNGLTRGLTRGWRQSSDVSPTPPDGLMSGATTKDTGQQFGWCRSE